MFLHAVLFEYELRWHLELRETRLLSNLDSQVKQEAKKQRAEER
jgi:hypothetical protein